MSVSLDYGWQRMLDNAAQVAFTPAPPEKKCWWCHALATVVVAYTSKASGVRFGIQGCCARHEAMWRTIEKEVPTCPPDSPRL